jgi:hypothetical protein
MKAGHLAAGLALLTLGLLPAAAAQELSLSLGAGGFIASQSAYRQVYGSGIGLAGDLWFKIAGPFGLASGFGRFADDGTAVILGSGGDDYPVKFRRTTIPLVAFYEFGTGAVGLRAGAGIGVHSYKEAWQTVDLVFEGRKVSPRFVLAVSARLVEKLSVLCSVTYDSIRTGESSPLARNVDLGGFQVLGGLSFRIF